MQRIIAEQEPPRPSTRLGTMQQDQRTTVAQNRRMESSALTRLFQGDLDWVVMKCLEKERARRYETASALAADLQRHLGSEPVVARPPTLAYRFSKAFRRNRLAFASSVAVLSALIIGLTAASWQAVRASRAEGEQVRLRHNAELAATKEATARQVAVTARTRAEASEENARRLLYAANLNLVQASWEENNLRRARELLRETLDSPYKGFEWYYWQRQLHGDTLSFRGHAEGIEAVAFSPDDSLVITGGGDGLAKVWSVANGQLLKNLASHSNGLFAISVSPAGDRIATGGFDNQVRLWDWPTGTEVFQASGHSGNIMSVKFFSKGQRLMTAGGDSVRIWDLGGRRLLSSIRPPSSEGGIGAADITEDGSRIAVGSGHESAVVTVFEGASTTATRVATWTGMGMGVRSLHFSPRGDRILAVTIDRVVRVLDTESGRQLATIGDGRLLARVAVYSPDGSCIATGGEDAVVRLWDAGTGGELRALKAHEFGISALAFSHDGNKMLSGSGTWMSAADSVVRLWDLSQGQHPRHLFRKPFTSCFARVSPNGREVLAYDPKESEAALFDLGSGQQLVSFKGSVFDAWRVTEGPEGPQAVRLGQDGHIDLFDVRSGLRTASLEQEHLGPQRPSIVIALKGDRLITDGGDSKASVWDARSGQRLFELTGHTDDIWDMAASPDGAQILTCGKDGTARLWRAEDGMPIRTFLGHRGIVASCAFSPDGKLAATGGDDLTVRIWEISSGRQVYALNGHGGAVGGVGFGPDGQRLATCSFGDKTVRIWDFVIGRELLQLRWESASPDHLVFSRDGLRLTVAGWADRPGTQVPAVVYDAASLEQVHRWMKEDEATAPSEGPP
jgi:WD40 repeat protein